PQDGDCIVRLQVEAAARRVAGGPTLSAPVEGDDADPRRRQQLVEVRVERALARPLAGSVQRDNRLLSSGRVARGQSEAVPLDLQLFQRSYFGNGREWTTASVGVGRVRATYNPRRPCPSTASSTINAVSTITTCRMSIHLPS